MCPLSRSPGWGLCRLSLRPRDQMELVFLFTWGVNPSCTLSAAAPLRSRCLRGKESTMRQNPRMWASKTFIGYASSFQSLAFAGFSTMTCDRHCSKCFRNTNPLTLLSSYYPSLHKWVNWGTDGLSNSPKVTQLMSDEARIWNPAAWSPNMCI